MVHSDERRRAVSPVIGVILMVAITVILAAVIGAFVLEIGDQQETAPSTSFDSNQQTEFFSTAACSGGSCANWTVVEITHAGGETLEISQTEAVYKGNDSLWGFTQDHSQPNVPSGGLYAYPQPNVIETLGTNEPQSITSGETLRFAGWKGFNDDFVKSGCAHTGIVTSGGGYPQPRIRAWTCTYNSFGNGEPWYPIDDSFPGYPMEPIATGPEDEPGNPVNIVWTAESGGKTQTLFKYTVQ